MIENYKITYTIVKTRHVELTLKCDQLKTADLSSLKCSFVGGSKVPVNMPEEFSKCLKEKSALSVGYGMSEVGVVVFDYPFSGKVKTVGKLALGIVM